MKISVNWMKQYGGQGLDGSIDDIVAKIGAQLGAVEEVIDVGAKYDGVLVVKVVSVTDHQNADRLHVCVIDDGGKTNGVERDADGHVQVVCGAPNVRAGLTVAWLSPGVTVPSTVDHDPFVLEARTIRGVVSNGMLASPKELGIGDSHEGILEIDEEATPGTPFVELYGLRDYVIDIENKMFTHRPDCFGQLGVAREIAGISQQAFTSPGWYAEAPSVAEHTDTLPIEVRNELPELVPRFLVVTLDKISVKPSPVWLQTYLQRVGIRPINNVVDITNYIMMLTGQPLHAYDYDKVKAQDSDAEHPTLVVRYPKKNETITLLNGKTVTPRSEAIMIATRDVGVGIGGVMGGADTEVDKDTKHIILECATFDMYSIRRTSMANGIFSDAVSRYNKGQSPLQNSRIVHKTIEMLHELAGGEIASAIIDDNHVSAEAVERDGVYPPVLVSKDLINDRLGLDLSTDSITKLLENVEFRVATDGANLTITAPFWRTDLAIPEDIVEEVGRLYGYDHVPLVLPQRSLKPSEANPMLSLKTTIRSVLASAGANEVLTYSFIHGKLIDQVGQDRQKAYQLSNALSPELQYYRMSLLPSLLDKIHLNVKAGYNEFALFELGKSHDKDAIGDDGLPLEIDKLALTYTTALTDKPGAAYYEAKTFLLRLARVCRVDLDFAPLKQSIAPTGAVFEPARSAFIHLKGHDEDIGVIGEFNTITRKNLKLPEKTAGFELSLSAFFSTSDDPSYVPLPRFPRVEQDISVKVASNITYQAVFDEADRVLIEIQPEQTIASLQPIDIYRRPEDPDHKHITLRLTIANYQKTMTDAEVSKILNNIAAALANTVGAERL